MAPLPEPTMPTVAAIYAHHAANRSSYRSYGLAVSELGTDCDRALFYRLRWADEQENIEGRKARLFETGNLEETRMLRELQAIGLEVHDFDDDGKQFALRGAHGHVRGKADGVVVGVPQAPKTWHLLELKSHSEKNFRKLQKGGVQKEFPKHYAQCQIGMHLLGLTRALYLAVSKNTDELHEERIRYDAEFCLRLMARAERIVRADHTPAKLHEDPKTKAAFACGFCPARNVCHFGALPEPHCRTCIHVSANIGGTSGAWNCARWNKPLTMAEQKEGCPAHLYNPAFVAGEQVDADLAAETITYRMPDGSVWVDGAARTGVAA